MNLVKLATAGLVLLSAASFAKPAPNCVRISTGDRSQVITNVCNVEIEVVWCHELDKKGYRSGLCGSDGKFYQKHRALDPGESTDNKYSLPLGTRINYGACTGGYYSTKQVGNNGRYSCK